MHSPRPPGRPLEPARSKWGFGGDEKERFVCTTAPFFFPRSHAGEPPLFLLEIIDSANSGFLIFSRSFVFFYKKRGRRQLPQAGEVRRPRRGPGVRLWLVCYVFLLLRSAMTK